MDVQALLRDPKAQLVIGGAAVVGLVVALRGRGGSGGGTGGTTTDLSGGSVSSGGGIGSYDSTSADIASQLGQFGVSQQAILDQYGKQLTDAIDALKQVAPAVPGAPPPATPPRTINVTPARPHYNAAKGDTLASIAKRFGVSVSQIKARNAKVAGYKDGQALPVGYGLWLA